jgi:hypothetical protein
MEYSAPRGLDPLNFEIYRGASCSFALYEDHGEKLAYQNKANAQTMIETIESAQVFTCRLGETHG